MAANPVPPLNLTGGAAVGAPTRSSSDGLFSSDFTVTRGASGKQLVTIGAVALLVYWIIRKWT